MSTIQNELNSQDVRTALFHFHAGPSENQKESIADCLSFLQSILEREEEEADSFEAFTAEGGSHYRSSPAVVHSEGDRFVVDFDYGSANCSYWPTYQDARNEAARVWNHGWAGQLVDFFAEAADRRLLDEAA